MPTITVFTDDENLANNVAEYKPFTVGDATDAWTLKFHNGTSFFAPSGVSMKIGHVNGLPDGTYNNAFLWNDRQNNVYTNNITVSSGVPTLSDFGTFKIRRSTGLAYSVDIPYGSGEEVVQDAINNAANGGAADTTDTVHVKQTNINEYVITRRAATGESGVPTNVLDAALTGFPATSEVAVVGSGTSNKKINTLTITNPGFAPTQRYTGNNGVYVLHGFDATLSTRGSLGNVTFTAGPEEFGADGYVIFQATGTGTGFKATASRTGGSSGVLNSFVVDSPGRGYSVGSTSVVPSQTFAGAGAGSISSTSIINFDVLNTNIYQVPFLSNASSLNVLAATTLSPFSSGKIEDNAEFSDSTLVIRPRDIATASLSQSGTDYVGTLNPINNYVSARLALRGSTQVDLQIFGDNQMLFQGKLTILNKIA